MSANDRYLIILDKVREDLQPATAMFLSGCFSLPPASTKNIAASGPIALISDVSERQGEAVLAELNASAPEGVTLRLDKENSGAKVSRLQWPRPPRIFGRNLKEFEPSQPEPRCTDVNCPHCGGRVRIGLDQNGEIVVVGATPEVSPVCVTPPRPGSETDRDPLFAGIKPLAIDTSGYASLKSLQAGDTGFWTDLSNDLFAPQTQSVPGAQPNQPPPHMSAYTLEPKERQPLDSPAAPTADASRTSGSGSGSGGKRTGSSGGKSSTG
ncbi:MAG: hypothetical protein LIP23_04575, partial [Planctomycetes bacterium]|nr:hypothetical protein [Planctomycetota bacterium]